MKAPASSHSRSSSWRAFARGALFVSCAVAPALCALAVGATSAQTSTRPIGVFPGNELPGSCGYTVDSVGDLDGDGFAEVIAGAPESMGTQNIGSWVGRAMVIAGRDGRRLCDIEGTQHQGRFGWSVRGFGDLDGDGVRDFAITAPQETHTGFRSGAVYIYSGKTFTVLRKLCGSAGDYLGISVANVRDVDGDGVDDILAGGHGGALTNQGVAMLWSGKTGNLIHRFLGGAQGDFLGHAVEGGVDIDADGTPDLVIGVPDEDTNGINSGMVVAYSGRTFGILWSFHGDGAADNFGHSVSFVGDIDHDGVADVVVGAPQFLPTTVGTGYLRILSGKTGKSLRRWAGSAVGDWFSEPVVGIGDWNADGTPDVLVGSSRASQGAKAQCGRADILSGIDGKPLQSWYGSSNGSWFGFSARAAGDFDANGARDLVVGAPGENQNRGLVVVVPKVTPELTIGFNEASISMPNTLVMELEVPKKYEGQLYFTLGSVSGRSPGLPVGPVTVPLNGDFYTDALLAAPNTFVKNGLGLVPFGARSTMTFGLSPGFSTALIGVRIDHAVLLVDIARLQFTHATNAVALRLVR
ncbi:MAG: FG-GAP repeat protein [Planctomycetes bacterium]|nr:FG-GAP repeat protein [Planctomycetota bacterium]